MHFNYHIWRTHAQKHVLYIKSREKRRKKKCLKWKGKIRSKEEKEENVRPPGIPISWNWNGDAFNNNKEEEEEGEEEKYNSKQQSYTAGPFC